MTELRLEDFELHQDSDGDWRVHHLGHELKQKHPTAFGNSLRMKSTLPGLRWYYHTRFGARRAVRRVVRHSRRDTRRNTQREAYIQKIAKVEPAWWERIKDHGS